MDLIFIKHLFINSMHLHFRFVDALKITVKIVLACGVLHDMANGLFSLKTKKDKEMKDLFNHLKGI